MFSSEVPLGRKFIEGNAQAMLAENRARCFYEARQQLNPDAVTNVDVLEQVVSAPNHMRMCATSGFEADPRPRTIDVIHATVKGADVSMSIFVDSGVDGGADVVAAAWAAMEGVMASCLCDSIALRMDGSMLVACLQADFYTQDDPVEKATVVTVRARCALTPGSPKLWRALPAQPVTRSCNLRTAVP